MTVIEKKKNRNQRSELVRKQVEHRNMAELRILSNTSWAQMFACAVRLTD